MQVEALTPPAGQVVPVNQVSNTIPVEQGQANFGQLFQLFAMQYGQGVTPDNLKTLMPQNIDPQAMLAMLGQANTPIPLQLLSAPTNLVNESQMAQADMTAVLQTLLSQLDGQLDAESLNQVLSEMELSLDGDSEAKLDPATLNGLLSMLSSLQTLPQLLPPDQPALQPEIIAKAAQALTQVPSTPQVIAGLAQQNAPLASLYTPATSSEPSPELTAFVERIATVLNQTQTEATSQGQVTPTVIPEMQSATESQSEFVQAMQTVSETTIIPSEVEVEPLTPALTPVPTQNVTPVNGVSSPVMVEQPTNLPTTPVINQVAEAIVVTQAEGKTDVRLTLQPEALGQVLVQLQLNDGDLSVRLLAETAQAQAAIRDHLPQLKSALAAQGLQVAGFTLDVGGDASDLNNSGQPHNQQPQAQPYPWHFANATEADHPDLMTSQVEQRQLGLSSINYHV